MKEKIKPYNKTFEGSIVKVVKPVATIEFEKIEYHPKFERFSKKTIKMKARIPNELLEKVKIGDSAVIAECRPLSKTIHHLVIETKENPEKKSKTKK